MKHDWEYKKLGEVCDVLDAQRKPVSKAERKNGIYPYYGASGIQDYVDSYLFDGRYLLVGEDGAKWTSNERSAYIVSGKCWVNNHAHILQMKNDIVDSFVEFYLCHHDLSSYITGAVVPKLTQQALKSIPIPVPPLPTQQSIVSELDSLSKIIADCKETLKDYDALEQSIFYDMFGDPVKNEKGWEVKKLGDCCSELKYGTSRPACENGQYKYLRMGNLTLDGHLDLTDLKTIDIPDDEIDKCIVKYGDILFNRTNSMELIGKTCMFDLEEPMVIAGYIIRVRLLDTLNPRFLSIMFNLPSLKLRLKSMAKGAVNQANINSKELASIRVILPPLPLQQQFASKIEAIEQMKVETKKALQEAETLFQARMDYWFN